MSSTILQDLLSFAVDNGFDVQQHPDHLTLSRTDLTPTINFKLMGDSSAYVYLYCRTTSWELPGERTDANDIVSTLFAAWLRCTPRSFGVQLLDIDNPAVYIPGELYARYLTLNQPYGSIVSKNHPSFSELVELTKDLAYFQGLFSYLFMWERGREQDYTCTGVVKEWSEAVSAALGEKAGEKLIYNRRWGPDWLYYRGFGNRISVMHAPRAAAAIHTLFRGSEGPGKELNGVSRRLFASARIKNAVSLRTISYARKFFDSIEIQPPRYFSVLPLENKIVFAGNGHVLFIAHEAGLKQFQRERLRVERRHREESAFLFPAVRYQWAARLDDERFEQLIHELLSREPGVTWLRKVGHSRDADRGKDIIVEWMTPQTRDAAVVEERAPIVLRRVLVQVKAAFRAIGKSDVRDIRDTVELHEASGFFLAVSSYISSDLTDALNDMRKKGQIWVDWWNRFEIEDRLNSNPDIAQRFTDLVTRVDTS